jgi:hypothetical protein
LTEEEQYEAQWRERNTTRVPEERGTPRDIVKGMKHPLYKTMLIKILFRFIKNTIYRKTSNSFFCSFPKMSSSLSTHYSPAGRIKQAFSFCYNTAA